MRRFSPAVVGFVVLAGTMGLSSQADATCRECTNAWFVMQNEWRHKIPETGPEYGRACGNAFSGPCHSDYELDRCRDPAHPEGGHPLCIIVDNESIDPADLTRRLLAAARSGDHGAIASLAGYAPASVSVGARGVEITGCGGQLVAFAAIANSAVVTANN